MTEEPYRWVEAVANRREYIETQLAGGTPIVALGCREGILFVTIGQTRQKLFEIYDRIGMGAIGHPADIERLRLAAIELASTEGFTRSAADVSLRRLAFYSLSPVLKNAFEQVYGAPYLARMLFAELGAQPEDDLFLGIDYDGAISGTSSHLLDAAPRAFAVVSGTRASTELMESFLQENHRVKAGLDVALDAALDVLTIGSMALGEDGARALPAPKELATARARQLETRGVEAAILERNSRSAVRYRPLTPAELEPLVRR